MIIFLAHQAWLMADAILRTLFRLRFNPQASSRMGAGRSDRLSPAAQHCGLLPSHGRRRGDRSRSRGSGLDRRSRDVAHRYGVRRGLDRVASRRSVGKRVAPWSGPATADGAQSEGFAADCPSYLAFFSRTS